MRFKQLDNSQRYDGKSSSLYVSIQNQHKHTNLTKLAKLEVIWELLQTSELDRPSRLRRLVYCWHLGFGTNPFLTFVKFLQGLKWHLPGLSGSQHARLKGSECHRKIRILHTLFSTMKFQTWTCTSKEWTYKTKIKLEPRMFVNSITY